MIREAQHTNKMAVFFNAIIVYNTTKYLMGLSMRIYISCPINVLTGKIKWAIDVGLVSASRSSFYMVA